MIHRCCTLFLFALLASLSGGCSWSMKMPPESKRAVMLSPGEAATNAVGAYWTLTELGMPAMSNVDRQSFYDFTFTESASRVAVSADGWTKAAHGGYRTSVQWVGVWNKSDGALVACLDHGPGSSQFAGWPSILAYSEADDLMLTFFDDGLYLWRVSTETTLHRTDIAALDRERGVTIPPNARITIYQGMIERGGTAFSIHDSDIGTHTWDTETGEPLAPTGTPWPPRFSAQLATHGDMVVTKDFKLKRGDKEFVKLETMKGDVATGRAAMFSPDGHYLVGAFWARPAMLDTWYDTTPLHLRVWSVDSGELVVWLGLEGAGRQWDRGGMTFVGEHEIAVLDWTETDGPRLWVSDLRERREVARSDLDQYGRPDMTAHGSPIWFSSQPRPTLWKRKWIGPD